MLFANCCTSTDLYERRGIFVAKKLRIGIVGTGSIAHAHMRAYKQFEDVEIVAGADIVPGKAKAFFQEFNLPAAQAFSSLTEMIKNTPMDGVSVCTYNTTHAVCAIEALEAGLHVLCEKPMSFTLQEGIDMVKVRRKAGKILTIGFQPRYDYMRQKIDRMIAEGAIGKVYYIQSGGGRRRGIPGSTFVDKEKAGYGCLGDIGCYSIDEALHAVAYPKPLTVSAMASAHFGKNKKYFAEADRFDVDDFSAAFVRMEGDVTYIFKQSWAMHADTLGDTLWLGTEGGIKLLQNQDTTGKPSRYMYFTDVNGVQVDSFVNPSYAWGEWNVSSRDVFACKVRDFCDAIKEGRGSPIPAEEIIYNQAICDGIYRSSKLGREVDIVVPSF